MHPSVVTEYSIKQFILDQYPDIWIHAIDGKTEPGTLRIKVSRIDCPQELELMLLNKLPAGVRLDLRVVSTASEFFNAKINRPDAPWKDIK